MLSLHKAFAFVCVVWYVALSLCKIDVLGTEREFMKNHKNGLSFQVLLLAFCAMFFNFGVSGAGVGGEEDGCTKYDDDIQMISGGICDLGDYNGPHKGPKDVWPSLRREGARCGDKRREVQIKCCPTSLVEMLTLVRENPANFQNVYNLGRYPIHIAAAGYFDRCVLQVFIDENAQQIGLINYKDANGNTPLHLAYSSENMEAAVLLIELGANEKEQNNEGQTPEKYAEGKRGAFKVAVFQTELAKKQGELQEAKKKSEQDAETPWWQPFSK